ncbi:MAG TPA: hypothetical protein VFA53_08025 [Xanthobacteraceae bacterium]|nr:hypothetical protein [Xanthobacteraceae bacterium]
MTGELAPARHVLRLLLPTAENQDQTSHQNAAPVAVAASLTDLVEAILMSSKPSMSDL